MRRLPDPVMAAIGAVVLSVSLAACGGSTHAYSGAPAPAGVEFPAVPGAPAPGALKMSANSASEAELVTALRAAGVSNPERWAEEIIEYRPYASNDVELTKLVQNLTKYNPGPQTLEKILSVLQP
ncbi:MAG TPA: hypothetical protein VJT72_05325 [Pseudonocardiaceae bacterium]|nr:hypothetical protein [Pseudonocardiaceae bacterium]